MNNSFIEVLKSGLEENKCELVSHRKEGKVYYVEVNVLDDSVKFVNVKIAVMFAMYSNGLEEAVSVKVNKEEIKDFILDPLGAIITFVKITMALLTAVYAINLLTVRSYGLSMVIAAFFLILATLIILEIGINKKKSK